MASLDMAATSAAPFYFDEKRKLSKREQHPSRSCSRRSTGGLRGTFTKISSSSARHRRCSFTRKCARLVKEQKARFYIIRRCVTMLLCWHDCSDS